MTILAGILVRHPRAVIEDAACETLRTSISRNLSDQRIEFRDARAFLVKVDIGAFCSPAFSRAPVGSVAMLAGEPLLAGDVQPGSEREVDLERLHAQWVQEDFEGLRNASGTFCAVYYDPRTGVARLIADRLGLRPLYYSITNDFIYFASALRILEACAAIPKTMDFSAVVETTGFGYPFGAGTPYSRIRVLRPCEIIECRGMDVTSLRYFRWDSIQTTAMSECKLLRVLYERFQAAVRRRLRGDKITFAYLSGGLDSRCTVAALCASNVLAYTFNFSPLNTQDQVFAREFAQKIGTIHQEVPHGSNPDWSVIMARAWQASHYRTERPPERPNLTWTGEGGSVGLGHVYLSPEIVSHLRKGNWDDAISVFLQQQRKAVLTRLLNPKLAAQFGTHLHRRLRGELDAIRHPDPVRAFHIFLNLNGPRRHLARHFETIDRHRLEFQNPFYDAELLEYITSLPSEPCLYHRLYVRWLSLFDPVVLAVPWQAYPGHVRSSIPVPQSLPDQWAARPSLADRKAAKQDLLERSAAMLSASDFPAQLLQKSYLRLIWWAYRLNVSDYSYALRAALTYYQHWSTASGHCELQGAMADPDAELH